MAPTTSSNQSRSPEQQPFPQLWTIELCHASLSCLSISTTAKWLAIAFEDSNLFFADFRDGRVLGTLNLESRFYVVAAAWRSDHALIVGCSNGDVLYLDFDPESKQPVTMHMLLKPMPSAIRALVYDPLSEYLAVAYGNQVSIYSLGITGGLGIKYWDCVERIPPPPGKLGETSHGLVTCLAFFGTSHRRRRLFVGYARLGFLVWMAPGSYILMGRTEPGVLTIGHGAISIDQQSIAISTLYQTAEIYPLTDSGPVVARGEVYTFRETTGSTAEVPIAFTANNIILKGTASGEVGVLDSERTRVLNSARQRLKPIFIGHCYVIHALETFDDRVVVGSSYEAISTIRCFNTRPTSDYRVPTPVPNTNSPFELSINDIMPQSEYTASRQSIPRRWSVFGWGSFCFALFSLAILTISIRYPANSTINV